MTKINYLIGDATAPIGIGDKFIVHCCNDIGAWGAGFVVAISKRWKSPEMEYRKWYKEREPRFDLGEVQIVQVEDNSDGKIFVCNIIGQRGIGIQNGQIPLRYEALEMGFRKIIKTIRNDNHTNATIHMPRIGCGLAGGDWEVVDRIIQATFCINDIQVFVYDFK
jgi:O-acetyl-ADP-ribose deacetylase (regulator of RNase III)